MTTATLDRTQQPTSFLRLVLAADALVSGATGLLMFAAANVLDPLLQIPAPLLRTVGLALVPYALAVGWLARREEVPRAAVWAVIACNAVYALECIGVLALGWIAPNALGVTFVLIQAVAVAAFAELQYVGLRK
jgi:hypothetical protein